ncbi:MAG TPA: Fur family transcriptional regulator [Polyangiaceae bacterium]|jgi:Fur family peroxide stress response transcriptional regulator
MKAETPRTSAMLRDLKRAGLKMTPQRLAIVRLFAEDDEHPTAQDLFERLRAAFPTMSFATVYNTLDALAKAGLAGIVRLPGKRGDAARFDPNTEPHHHAVCDACGAVLDIAAGTLAPTPGAVKKLRRTAPGFHVHAVERIYRGLCGRCTASRS